MIKNSYVEIFDFIITYVSNLAKLTYGLKENDRVSKYF